MVYRLLADGILIFHLCFVLFAVLGGLLILRWRKVIYLHIPAVLWAFTVQWFQWVCPLTPLENWFRGLGGQSGYEGGFIEHYVLLILYTDISAWIHTLLAVLVILINLGVYYYVFSKWWRENSN